MTKITDYLTKTTPNDGDFLVIADVATGETRKITRASFLAGAELPAETVDLGALSSDLQTRLNAFKILNINFKQAQGVARQIFTSGWVAMAGATGDTSYTAPCNVDIQFTMTIMGMVSSGVGDMRLSIDGTTQAEGTYFTGGWNEQTISYKVSVNAGATITIGAKGNGAGFTVCNASGDAQYPTRITGVVIPRAV